MDMLLALCLLQHIIDATRPNIIFMFGDDIGFNDIQFMSNDLTEPSTDTSTPTLNQLATEGVIITNYYVHRMCSPTRAAFLTGRLPFRYSMDTHLLEADVAISLTRQVSLLSEEFKAAGYATHCIGKWHLGFQSWEYTPTYRGFDSFYGYYNSFTDYYMSNYNIILDDQEYIFFDLRDDEQPIKLDGDISDFSVYRFRDQTINMIEEHIQTQTSDTPFFLYLAWQSSHLPSEAPDYYYDMYYPNDDKSSTRMYNQAQTTAMDEAIGSIVDTLKEYGLWDNTLLVFSSDNGAAANYGDNFPLRGYKKTTFEGGLRVPAMISGGYLPSAAMGTTYGSVDGYVHVTDWYPTLLDAAGIEAGYVKSTLKVQEDYTPNWETASYTIPLDGISIWNQIIREDGVDVDDEDGLSQRLMILDLIRAEDDDCINGTVRWGKWKYILGLGSYDDTDGDDGYLWGESFSDLCDNPHLWGQSFANLDVDNSLGCDLNTDPINIYCFYSDNGCLFDIEADPCEYSDLSDEFPDILMYLKGFLEDIKDDLPADIAEEGLTLYVDSPQHWIPTAGGFWGPWQDYQFVEFEVMLFDSYNELYAAKDIIVEYDLNNKYLKVELSAFVMTVIVVIVCILKMKCKDNKQNKINENAINYGSTNCAN